MLAAFSQGDDFHVISLLEAVTGGKHVSGTVTSNDKTIRYSCDVRLSGAVNVIRERCCQTVIGSGQVPVTHFRPLWSDKSEVFKLAVQESVR
ncbi:hypothetical protein [Kushneria indalinina]|uniref:Uncharacterized protein n=1 Tax=Kushneria indalinina DSM 14324 TaxID=1122140 RepID=A0A3D9DT09_9GAMM|nr:hypothetical protein [Kushneria indalinina]REC93866.1 hypothetical protein C8D72_2224 [Kushneria indalinina DSM 14324]